MHNKVPVILLIMKLSASLNVHNVNPVEIIPIEINDDFVRSHRKHYIFSKLKQNVLLILSVYPSYLFLRGRLLCMAVVYVILKVV